MKTQQTKLYERPEISELLLKRVNALSENYRQNIAIIGYQNLGKSSLIFELVRKCENNINVIPIYLHMISKSIEFFANSFIGVLLSQYLNIENRTGQDRQDDIEQMIFKSKDKIPKTSHAIAQIKKMLKDNSRKNEIYSALLELPQVLHEETQKNVLLVIDEFHNLEQLGLDNPFMELSNKIMVQKHCMYIVISSAVYTAENILKEKLSLLFGNFEIIKILPFNNTESKKFIKNKVNDLTICDDLVNFLIHFTGGYPLYLDILSEQIKYECFNNNSDTITQDILLTSVIKAVYDEHSVLNQLFTNKYQRLPNNCQINIFAGILLTLARGYKKPPQISAFLNKKTQEITRHLNKLIQMDITSKKGVFYYINDPLFENWLKYVLQPKQDSFIIDINLAKYKFEIDIRQLVKNFIDESKKGLEQRLKELISLFNNDVIELERKRFILPHFDSVNIEKLDGAVILNAKRFKKYWIFCAEQNFIDEPKIGKILDHLNKKDYLKKIIIALNGMDANAKLKALESRIWIWDQNVLNELFLLFEKPRYIKV